MSDNMVERVARAIYEREPTRDQETDIDGRAIGNPYTVAWGDICDCYPATHEMMMEFAVAAIEAMREPSDQMTFVGQSNRYTSSWSIGAIWRTMIDAALSE